MYFFLSRCYTHTIDLGSIESILSILKKWENMNHAIIKIKFPKFLCEVPVFLDLKFGLISASKKSVTQLQNDFHVHKIFP